jgi:hypothetical protein
VQSDLSDLRSDLISGKVGKIGSDSSVVRKCGQKHNRPDCSGFFSPADPASGISAVA